MKPRAPSGIAAFTKCWSRSLLRRIEMIVPHCDSTPSARYEGRWVIRPSDTPYLRPSLAIRSRILRAARPVPTSFDEIGRAHVQTPVTNAHLVCRLLLGK